MPPRKPHASDYYVPKNLNVWYLFGSLALLALAVQVVTGVVLAMHYKPDAAQAFASVQAIMREVRWGWLMRYAHSTGASLLFAVMYLHLMRGLLYGSYRRPRAAVWLLGMLLFLCLMGEAFSGYLLPWGQTSYWGAQVIINLFDAIPGIGPGLALWIRGGYTVGDATLNRFFAVHVIAIPLLLAGLIALHIIRLRAVGANNPDGIDIKDGPRDQYGRPADGVPFYPYYIVRDLLGASAFLFVFAAIVFFAPAMHGYFLEYANFIPADPLHTPADIAPVWYFTPFYAILRAVDSRFWGVAALAGSVAILFLLPWLDRAPVRSIRYRPGWHKLLYAAFIADFLLLGCLGVQAPNALFRLLAQGGTLAYFGFFALMPLWSRLGRFKPVPDRVTSRVTFRKREARP